jgi:hypothetical protein
MKNVMAWVEPGKMVIELKPPAGYREHTKEGNSLISLDNKEKIGGPRKTPGISMLTGEGLFLTSFGDQWIAGASMALILLSA